MCGIAGIIHKGKSTNVGGEMQKMLQSLKHRGPDSTGYALYGDGESNNYILRFKVGENVKEGSSAVMEDANIYQDRVQKVNEKISAKQLVRILDLIDEINSNLPSSNSQHLKLELFMMKLIKPEFGSDVKSIGYRLDLLEGRTSLSRSVDEDTKSEEKILADEKPKDESKPKEKKVKSKNKQSLEDFDVYWPKILNSLKETLSARKFSYLTAVKPEVNEDNVVTLYVDKNNEFLFDELKKSTEIIDLIKSEVAKLMGIEALVNIEISETINTKEEGGISAAQEIFDVEDLS